MATLLNRFLGMYVRNFDPKQLNVGIWSGEVTLRDLELRREALDQLKLPINVVAGHLGVLTLSIPWSNLKGKPVKVFIEDVYLVAAPKEDAEYDEEEEERRRQTLKMEKLDNAEMLKDRSGDGLSQEEQQKNQSFTDSLVTKIVDNLQISVKRIHVRYEDALSSDQHPFALGLTLAEFSAASTDEKWNPTFIQNSTEATHKLVKLGALAAYWNTDSDLLGTGKGTHVGAESMGTSAEEMRRRLREEITGTDSSVSDDHQFLLKPVNGRAMVRMDKTGKRNQPKVRAGLAFEEIGVMLDDEQYRDALMMIDLFHYFILHQQYKKYQPKGVSPKEDPRAWLRFAGEAVLQNIHDRNRRWSWSFIKERRDDRKRYIELFKKRKREQPMSAGEKEELEKLEWKLSYEDLRFWRSLARSELRKENVGHEKPKQKKQAQGWGSWLWGGKQQKAAGDEHDGDSILTDQHRKELYEAIEWDEKNTIAASVDVPRDTVKLEVEASLRSGSFTLKQDPHGKNNKSMDLLFDDFRAKVIQRPDSLLSNLSLGGLRAYDGTTKGNLYSQVVKVKDAANDVGQAPHADEDVPSPPMDGSSFFELEFEQNPLDGSADSALKVKLKAIEVVYNPQFIVGVTQFFKPPERHLESIGVLMESAGATVEGFRQQTRAGLEFALEEHKTIDAKLDLQAPLIIIPESVTVENAMCMILDAGHVHLKSELVDKASLQEIRSKQQQQYNDEDFKQLEGLMYDKFRLKLEDTQLLIGPSIRQTKAQLQQKDGRRHLHLIDRISMDFVLESLILPKAQNLTRFRVSGHLPILHVSASDQKYTNLMKLIDTATPKFGSDENQSASKNDKRSKGRKEGSAEEDNEHRRSQLRSKSFQFSAQDHELVVDDESDHEDKDFEDAHDNRKPQAQSQQTMFELKFNVDKLQGSLYKADPEGKDDERLLVDLIAEHFELTFGMKPVHMVAEVSLQSITVDDHIENGTNPEFQKIITSEVDQTNSTKHLLHVKYEKVNKESPDFMTVYEGIETHVDVSLATINLVITRRTLLTLQDFIMTTFQSPPQSAKAIRDKDQEDKEGPQTEEVTKYDPPSDNKMRIKIHLKSIVSILNSDGVRLATLSLTSAEIGIFLMDKTMRVSARLGNATLIDDINQGAPIDSPFRQLLTIDGDELADFRYETFDPDVKESYPGYNSFIFLRAGSFKLNFLQEPFRNIIDFFVKFGKMQAIFNAARQAAMNQADRIQENANQSRFDIIVRTPIIVFPKSLGAEGQDRDILTAYLGEIYANNQFVPLDDTKDADIANKLSVGIRHIRMTSEFHYPEDKTEELEIIDKVDLDFRITYLEHHNGAQRPDAEVQGYMSDINLRLTQLQLRFLMELSRTVPAVFTVDEEEKEEEVLEELPSETVEPAKAITEPESPDGQRAVVSLQPELGSDPKTWTKLDMIFKVETIGLELLSAQEDAPVGDVEAASLSKFSLDDTSVKLRMMSDNSLESELLIHSFTIKDRRKKNDSKFRKIMSTTNRDVQQFMASVTMSGTQERSLVVITTVDSPRLILALDYLIAIQQFFTTGLALGEPDEGLDNDADAETVVGGESGDAPEMRSEVVSKDGPRTDALSEKNQAKSTTPDGTLSLSLRVNVVDAQVVLIADPSSASSEAIVLSTKQVLMSQQHALTLQISQVGMFLCRMDKFDGHRLRILDDFSIQMSMQSRSQGQQSSITSIHIGVEPLVLRLALRDILLAIEIINKASELSNKASQQDTETKGRRDTRTSSLGQKQSLPAASTARPKSSKKARSTRESVSGAPVKRSDAVIVRREEMLAEFEGIRVILIGDLHELPLIDLAVREFGVEVRDWSHQMMADASIELYMNIYDFSKSAWEPLVELWQLGLHVSQQHSPNYLSVELYSRRMMEITLTSASIALASRSAKFLSQEEDVLSKPRGVESPYRLRNQTGFDMLVWTDRAGEQQADGTKIEDGSEVPWQFEDWTKVRENLTPEGDRGRVAIRLEGSGFDAINHIPVTREGETVYNLRPKQDNVLHRLLVEVTLGKDSIKYITFRSPLLFENKTQIPIEIGVFDVNGGHLSKIEKIPPDESRPAPVGAAYMHSILVRPDQGFGYTWSNERLYWKDVMKRSVRNLTCRSEAGDQSTRFLFQMSANYDRNNPMTRLASLHCGSGHC